MIRLDNATFGYDKVIFDRVSLSINNDINLVLYGFYLINNDFIFLYFCYK